MPKAPLKDLFLFLQFAILEQHGCSSSRYYSKWALCCQCKEKREREQVSTTVPKSAILRFCPSRETCWGVPSPNPADRRSAPVLWRSRATKIRQPRLLRSRLTRRKSEAVSAIAAERRTRRNSTPALRLYCSIGPIRQN